MNGLLIGFVVMVTMISINTRGETRPATAPFQIGYVEYQTSLPGGRHANVATMRACLVNGDGTGRRTLSEELIVNPDTWTQFAGWSPDGNIAIIGCGWEDPDNAAWEEQHKEFRMIQGWSYDTYFLELSTGKLSNLTAIERVSDYNTGIFFWPGDANRLGFTALIDGISHPFSMDLDGRNKTDLSTNADGFAYGYSASPDGTMIAYHEDYQVYLARADGTGKKLVETNNPFNFMPTWSPDGQWILFLSGQHYNCHPFLVDREGNRIKKIGDRNGYPGVVEFLDVYDYHGGSSDTPVWSPDGKTICFAGRIDQSVELQTADLDGNVQRLTCSEPDVMNYQPKYSPDGRWIIFGSNRTCTRQLYVMECSTKQTYSITDVQPRWGAMWPHWQPKCTSA